MSQDDPNAWMLRHSNKKIQLMVTICYTFLASGLALFALTTVADLFGAKVNDASTRVSVIILTFTATIAALAGPVLCSEMARWCFDIGMGGKRWYLIIFAGIGLVLTLISILFLSTDWATAVANFMIWFGVFWVRLYDSNRPGQGGSPFKVTPS